MSAPVNGPHAPSYGPGDLAAEARAAADAQAPLRRAVLLAVLAGRPDEPGEDDDDADDETRRSRIPAAVVMSLAYPALVVANGRCRIVAVIRFIVRTGIALAANAVGLLVAAALLEGVQLDAGGFIVAVIVFTVAYALMLPFLASQLRRRNSSAIGGVALIAALVGLVVTDVFTDGLSIDGLGAWVGATVLVWAGALLAAFILPYLGLRKYLDERRT